MKKILLLVSVSLVLIITSCKKDSNTDARDQYLATYGVSETFTNVGGGTGTDTYDITITKSTTKATTILISNFGNQNVTAEATVSENTISIISQTITVGGSIYGLSGSGSINGNILNISYTVNGSWSGVCVCTKK
jgi:hypothetical protein